MKIYSDESIVKYLSEFIWNDRGQSLAKCFLFMGELRALAVRFDGQAVYDTIRLANEVEKEILHIARRGGCFNENLTDFKEDI